MSRVTAPVSKLSRALSSTPTVRSGNTLLDSTAHVHNAGAVLMPKYAELLRASRNNEHVDSSRTITTTHRPTPQPSLANRSKPLMQPFSSTSSAAAAATPSSHIDATRIPNMAATPAGPEPMPAMPLLPDNYGAAHIIADADVPAGPTPEVTIVAADPEKVLPGTPMREVEGPGLDGVELKFAHEQSGSTGGDESTLLGDLWRGMVDDVFGPKKTAS